MLDEKDRAILRELRSNAKATTKTIAEKTGIPRTTVHDRIGKMEAAGVIRKFTIIPNYESLGEGTTAFIFVSHDPSLGPTQKELAEEIGKLEGVYEVHLVSGDWDIIAKVRGPDVEHIGEIVMDKFRNLKGLDKTVTSTCFRTIKEEV